ncbi:hypothetical protein Ancab_033942 [Ancistrocladus abbreviatus]
MEDFKMALKKDSQTSKNRNNKQSNSLKIGTIGLDAIITCDALVDDNGSCIAVIIRDGPQHFIQATIKSCGIVLPVEAKAIACLEVVKRAVFNGWHRVVIFGDCKVVMDSINSDEAAPWSIAHVINRIKDCCCSLLEVKFVFFSRQFNVSAYLSCRSGRQCKVKEEVTLSSISKFVLGSCKQEDFSPWFLT